jgi:hypothetical protein
MNRESVIIFAACAAWALYLATRLFS